MVRIGILVGSLRKDSYNMKIARYIMKNYKDKAYFQIIDIEDFPLFNEDLEDNVPRPILHARGQIKNKDGIIIISPEYNHSIPGVLKNALDWFSRDDYVMMKKPYMLMGASSGGIGTARMQGHLRQVLNSGAFQMYSMPNNEFLFARIQDHMDEDGNLTNQSTIKKLDNRIDSFLQFIEIIQSSNR
ncbi:MAG TPA: NAD(P)H-dependent oxidoreductase [Tepidimicrobium sp.]|nr:NAD(P)H-dependent oxidoreductase [Tepidimicrobium sp.]